MMDRRASATSATAEGAVEGASQTKKFCLQVIKKRPRKKFCLQVIKKRPHKPNVADVHECSRINLDYCKLPPYPEHGLYIVVGDASAAPGAERASASLEYACRGGYSLVGKWRVRCENGTWHDDAPQCLKIHAIESIGFADIVHDVVVILNDVFD
ncbi:hypothetical protein EVAR_76119_1 [Eumeta japonica]|uniref:Sushi domain-containing protein n=1 Tax=Eumeta variegata TaxID=151549 RepID=A0A4C2A9U0_EUMVA|nr:hypothetical protein EVAR_76119_1 [Eumeta japonica]